MTTPRLALVLGLTVSVGAAVHAQFTVFDPTSYAELIEQYQQLVRTYDTVRAEYDVVVAMATRLPLNMRVRYHIEPTAWGSSYSTNVYGTSGPWTEALNGAIAGASVFDAYRLATEPLRTYDAATNTIPPDQLDRAKRQYASAELLDAATIRGMRTMGRVRGSTHGVEDVIRNLEQDAFADTNELQTQVGVLNKINAVGLVAVRVSQDTNKLLIALLEGRLAEAKRQREAEVQRINADVEWRLRAADLLNRPMADTTTALTEFRWP